MQLANALTLPSAGRSPHGFSTEVPRGGRASDHTRLTLPGLGRGAQGKGTRECSGMQRRWEQPCRWSFLRRARLAAGEGGRESQGVPGCKRRALSRPPGGDPLPHSPLIALAAFGVPGSGSGLAAPASPAGRQKDGGGTERKRSEKASRGAAYLASGRRRAGGWPAAGRRGTAASGASSPRPLVPRGAGQRRAGRAAPRVRPSHIAQGSPLPSRVNGHTGRPVPPSALPPSSSFFFFFPCHSPLFSISKQCGDEKPV